jgi:predicted nucleic acid-binding protein
LPLDVQTARVLGSLADFARGSGQSPDLADLATAATAKYDSFMVLMGNMRHFRNLDISAHDPFASLPLYTQDPSD